MASLTFPLDFFCGFLRNLNFAVLIAFSVKSALAQEVVQYKVNWGEQPQQFAVLYKPAKMSSPVPVIIMIHGGCWSAAYDLSLQNDLSFAFAKQGFAVWNIEFRRLGNGGEYPVMFQDVGAAADYLRQISSRFNLDLTRVVALGHSSGAHLALWLAGRDQLPQTSVLYTPDPFALGGVIALGAITDLKAKTACGNDARSILYSRKTETSNGLLHETSPLEMLPLNVASLLISGKKDKIVPPKLAKIYSKTAAKMGSPSEHRLLSKADHFQLIRSDFMGVDSMAKEIYVLFEKTQKFRQAIE